MHDGPWITYSDSLNRSLHLAGWLKNRGMGVGTIVALGLTAHERLEVVLLKPGTVMDLERLVVQCGEHMVSFDVSRDLIITDALPRNTSGKVLKREIRGRLQ
jgi:acyl-CoA synthetase (AMP-forming)/AMP-acid ligase II